MCEKSLFRNAPSTTYFKRSSFKINFRFWGGKIRFWLGQLIIPYQICNKCWMAPIHHSCCKNFNAVYPVQNDLAKNGQLALMMNLFFKKKVRLEEIENCLKFPKSPKKFLDIEIQAEIFNKVLEIQANKKVGILR